MQDLDRLSPRELLDFIRRSFQRGKPAQTKGVSPKKRMQTRAAATNPPENNAYPPIRGILSPAVEDIIRSDVTLRMRCIRLLRDADSLTIQETADTLQIAPAQIKSQFLRLRQLELIESEGVRKTGAGVESVYRLKELNPALEFVLAQGPEGIKSPHEIAERERPRRP